jgi:MscS family membrane protein
MFAAMWGTMRALVRDNVKHQGARPGAGQATRVSTWLRAWLILLLAGGVLSWLAPELGFVGIAQAAPGLVPSASATAGSSGKDEDVLVDSPRASVTRYLEACRRAEYTEAARYLDLQPPLDKRGPDLAERLYAVLNHHFYVDVEQLSPASAGKTDDGLPTNTDELGRIRDRAGRLGAVRLVRVDNRGEARWVFSQSTVTHIDAWYDELDDRWMRQHMPAVLMREGPEALLYWQWIALPLSGVLGFVLARLLASLTRPVVRVLLSRRATLAERINEHMRAPYVTAGLLVFFALVIPHLRLYVAAEAFLWRVTRAASYATFFWALIRVAHIFVLGVKDTSAQKAKPTWSALADLSGRASRIVIAVIGTVAVLSELGYPVASLIAGLGIGGIAIALAAQKTVENLFGSASILADQPFRVGESIRVDGIEGTVEFIGLRSTRIRTADRTLIILPNGKLADMRIEAFAARDRFRSASRLMLAADTPQDRLASALEDLRAHLARHEKVRKADTLVYVRAFSEQGYEVELSFYLEVATHAEFVAAREGLLLDIAGRLVANEVRLADGTSASNTRATKAHA